MRGQRIRWAREIVEPNRLAFARKLGVDVTTLRDIENGKRNPGILLAYQIFHALRISLDYAVAGRLTGVDPELAVLLLQDHPELAPPRPPARKPRSPGKERQPSTFPMIGAAQFP